MREARNTAWKALLERGHLEHRDRDARLIVEVCTGPGLALGGSTNNIRVRVGPSSTDNIRVQIRVR
jgi:hypothetical protein